MFYFNLLKKANKLILPCSLLLFSGGFKISSFYDKNHEFIKNHLSVSKTYETKGNKFLDVEITENLSGKSMYLPERCSNFTSADYSFKKISIIYLDKNEKNFYVKLNYDFWIKYILGNLERTYENRSLWVLRLNKNEIFDRVYYIQEKFQNLHTFLCGNGSKNICEKVSFVKPILDKMDEYSKIFSEDASRENLSPSFYGFLFTYYYLNSRKQVLFNNKKNKIDHDFFNEYFDAIAGSFKYYQEKDQLKTSSASFSFKDLFKKFLDHLLKIQLDQILDASYSVKIFLVTKDNDGYTNKKLWNDENYLCFFKIENAERKNYAVDKKIDFSEEILDSTRFLSLRSEDKEWEENVDALIEAIKNECTKSLNDAAQNKINRTIEDRNRENKISEALEEDNIKRMQEKQNIVNKRTLEQNKLEAAEEAANKSNKKLLSNRRRRLNEEHNAKMEISDDILNNIDASIKKNAEIKEKMKKEQVHEVAMLDMKHELDVKKAKNKIEIANLQHEVENAGKYKKQKMEKELLESQKTLIKIKKEAAPELIKENKSAQERAKEEREKAKAEMARNEAQHKNRLEYMKKFQKALQTPRNYAYAGAAAIIIYLCYKIIYEAIPYLMRLIFKKEPELILFTNLKKNLLGRYRVIPLRMSTQPIYRPALQKQLSDLVEEVSYQLKSGKRRFPVTLMYGPPGTGKTLMAKYLAYSTKMPIIIISGSALHQFSKQEATQKLTELLTFIKRLPIPVILFIDEADAILVGRNDPKSSETTKNLVTTILAFFPETRAENIHVVLTTNLPNSIDSAVLSRCGNKLQFLAPTAEERKKMLTHYVELLYAKPQKLTLDKSLKQLLSGTADKMEGFVGREIKSFVERICAALHRSGKNQITKKIINEVLTTMINNKNAIEANIRKLEQERKEAATS